jgi:hypothetical protein
MADSKTKRSLPRRYWITDFSEQEIDIPIAEADDDPYFVLSQADDIRKYYAKKWHGVVRGLLPQQLCDRAAQYFETEVKPFGGFIYRQVSGKPEQHMFTNEGFMLNSILNI